MNVRVHFQVQLADHPNKVVLRVTFLDKELLDNNVQLVNHIIILDYITNNFLFIALFDM